MSEHIHAATIGTDDAPVRVAFLHGLFGRGKNFTAIAKALEPDAQSLLVDLPDHGKSLWTEHFDYDEIADLVAGFLRAGIAANGPIDIVGHSMGGKVAMVLALRHPDLVRRLVVVDISPTASGSTRGEFEHYLSSLASLDLGALRSRIDAHAALREAIPNDTVRGFLLQNLQRTADGFGWEPNLELLHRDLDRIGGFPEEPRAIFTCPVLWISGDRSNYITDAREPAMRALFPNTERLTVRDSGHWVHSEQPEAFVAALRDFLV